MAKPMANEGGKAREMRAAKTAKRGILSAESMAKMKAKKAYGK